MQFMFKPNIVLFFSNVILAFVHFEFASRGCVLFFKMNALYITYVLRS